MHSSPETSSPQSSTTTPSDAVPEKADINQMFVLIEGILPFEACLYYQVLPLSIEGSCLNLGMVNPHDQAAADYVRRLVSYINCSIVSRPIPSDWHREILSKFLSHSAKNRSATTPTASGATASAQAAATATNPPERQANHRPPTQNSQTPSAQSSSQPNQPFAEQPTLVVNTPDNLVADPSPSEAPSPEPTVEPATAPPALTDLPDHNHSSTTPTADVLPSLQHLPPQALTEALLDRVIDEGIGRLYLERQPQFGRILWSKDGVLQSVLEQIDLQVFQGVINELKLMVNLSLIPARKPRQVEIERLHREQPILIRFRLIPGNHGEEATLQVLRGAALKFYQQQQFEKMGRDALGVAQTLQQRLNEIRRQARQNLPTDPVPHEALPAIVEMLKNMEQQVNEIMKTSDSQ